ncbi:MULTISPECIES: MFS transporter [Sphingomonas]|jgi:MFS family permease|uniref:Putative major facilitator superfamily transporter n=1 Tax=Sphingomonas parapaucimobilis NBRC 15100 TaxID=1219049 RepID=A0A0A1W829_9SPHN|nr:MULTISPECIES: MFS transporter [Sphingomonas]OMJ32171.1 MFS transporter [Sphingomonas sp. Sph1(2015)]GAM01620.1 putative major facilitator superfamily transporter [Sphingomonas parapaucimobilis NBRC 15100]
MLNALGLLKQRRFLPLFATQFLGAFNDNLFKTSMVLFATYAIFTDPHSEFYFNCAATGAAILPFVFLSALSGQLADSHDKAKIIRIVKTVEIGIMLVGAGGLLIAKAGYTTAGLALMLGTVLALGVHSTFFGPIKYAILPQHLEAEDILGGTGLVEAGTYLAILLGTVAAGWIPIEAAAVGVIVVAVIGWFLGRQVPPAPREGPPLKLNYNPFTASWRLISATLHIRRLFLAIIAISFFWTIGAVLIIIFPPLVKNVLTADKEVASLAIAIFSIGVAIGSVVINTMLKGEISARYSPMSVIAMGAFVVLFSFLCRNWTPAAGGGLYSWQAFLAEPRAIGILATLLAIATTGGMFVVPLYAFLTTTVEKDQTARTVAANNIVNCFAMTIGSVLAFAISAAGVSSADMLFVVAAMCLVSAWLALLLHRACDDVSAEPA